LPLQWLVWSKPGRYPTKKADVFIVMWSRLQAALDREGMDRTKIPLTLDSWVVSQPLRERLLPGGFTKSLLAGKRHDTLTMEGKKQDAAPWKTDLLLHDATWGIDVPAGRVQGHRPTFGSILLFFVQTSTTRSYSLRPLRRVSLRGAAIWHIWKQHHLIACFWKILKAIFPIRARQWQGHGRYTAWLLKVLAYWLALRLQAHRSFSQLTLTQIRRPLSRDHDLRTWLTEHFHLPFLVT
jgi:hypothetical protein